MVRDDSGGGDGAHRALAPRAHGLQERQPPVRSADDQHVRRPGRRVPSFSSGSASSCAGAGARTRFLCSTFTGVSSAASTPSAASMPMSRADRSAGTLPHADSSTADALQDRHSAGGPAIFVSPGSGSRSGPFPLVTGLPAAPAVLAALQLGQPKSQPTDQLDPRPARVERDAARLHRESAYHPGSCQWPRRQYTLPALGRVEFCEVARPRFCQRYGPFRQ